MGSGCPVRSSSSPGADRVGLPGNALEGPVGKVELNDIDGPGNVPSRARIGRNDRHDAGTRRSNRD